jgi:hypothetical protein
MFSKSYVVQVPGAGQPGCTGSKRIIFNQFLTLPQGNKKGKAAAFPVLLFY